VEKLHILSRSLQLYSTDRLFTEAHKAGLNPRIIHPLYCDLILERQCPYFLYLGEKLKKPLAVLPRVGASITFFGTAVVRQYETMGVYTPVGSVGLSKSRNKLQALQNLSRCGLGMPKTVYANYLGNTDQLVDAVGGPPIVIKPLEGTQGQGIVLAATYDDAAHVLDAYRELGENVVIQEFIPESKGADLRAIVVGDKVVAAMKRQGKKGEFRSNLHLGGTASTVSLSRAEESTAVQAAKAMGLEVCGVDLLQSKRGPLVLEINSSPGLEGIEKTTGINVAKKIIGHVAKAIS
jgi:ribosomal protein S6--L-glutamate ligase